jgi:hypothetical protein
LWVATEIPKVRFNCPMDLFPVISLLEQAVVTNTKTARITLQRRLKSIDFIEFKI